MPPRDALPPNSSKPPKRPAAPAVIPGFWIWVVIIAGVNDAYQGLRADAIARELEAMYDAARAAGIPVVAGTILPYNTATAPQTACVHRVNEWIRAYSTGHAGIVFCDTRAAVAAPHAPDRLVSSPDDLHPSPDGYRLMALAIEPAIQQALLSSGGSAGASLAVS